jgi:hypothetical protein
MMRITLCATAIALAFIAPPPAVAREPESMCALQDAHRLELKPGIGFLEPGADVYARRATSTRIATCELRRGGRTIFQRYAATGKVVQRGFFLEGKRSGRWLDDQDVTIYAGGAPVQKNPSSSCDPVAKIGLAYTVYCPRNTPVAAMLADFRTWRAALNAEGLVFDVYSVEANTPDSKAAYRDFPGTRTSTLRRSNSGAQR